MTDSVLGVGAREPAQRRSRRSRPASRQQVPAFLRRSPTLRLFGKRLLMAIPVLLGVSFITFSLMNLSPATQRRRWPASPLRRRNYRRCECGCI